MCCKNTRPNRLSEGPGMKDRAIQRQDLGFIAEYGDCHPRFFYPTVNRFPFPPSFFFSFYFLSIFRDDPPRPSSQERPFEYSPGLLFWEAHQVGKAFGRREAARIKIICLVWKATQKTGVSHALLPRRGPVCGLCTGYDGSTSTSRPFEFAV